MDEKALKPIDASEHHKAMGYKHDCPSCGCSLGFKDGGDTAEMDEGSRAI